MTQAAPDAPGPVDQVKTTAPVDAIVLAAGGSRRMGGHNKLLLAGADGRTIVERVVATVRASQVRDICVVVGHEREAVQAALRGTGARFVECHAFHLGLASSLRAGLAALREDAAAVLICLGDMPLVQPATLDALIGAWRPGAIVVPSAGGRRGNPVLWDRMHVPRMQRLDGDSGARALLRLYASAVRTVNVADSGVLRDADTAAEARDLPGGPWRAADGTLV